LLSHACRKHRRIWALGVEPGAVRVLAAGGRIVVAGGLAESNPN